MTEIDYTAWRFWWDVVITLMLGVNVIYTWVVNRSKANASAIKSVDNRVSKLDSRVGRLESDIHHLPSHDDLGAIHEKVNDVAKGMEGLRGELSAINRTLGLINEHLLNGGRK